jgi:hypothetical protein
MNEIRLAMSCASTVNQFGRLHFFRFLFMLQTSILSLHSTRYHKLILLLREVACKLNLLLKEINCRKLYSVIPVDRKYERKKKFEISGYFVRRAMILW